MQTTRKWYQIGATGRPTAAQLMFATFDGPAARRAYLAGVMAWLFGVDLSATA